MQSFERLLATGIIWMAVAGITIAMAVTQQDSLNPFLVVVLLAAGFLTTAVIWGASVALASQANDRAEEKAVRERRAVEKPKRQNQDAMSWLSNLNEAQLNALETALAARHREMDEDEQIELNRLLAEQQNTRKGY